MKSHHPISHTEVTCQYCQAKIPLSWQQFNNFRKLVLWSGDENRDNDAARLDIPDWHDACRDYHLEEVLKDRR